MNSSLFDNTNLEELLSNTGLVRNTASIIINYLTDLQPLPFIDELFQETIFISHNDNLICYSNYYISSVIGKRDIQLKILKKHYGWALTYD
jgi:hypothetical protein